MRIFFKNNIREELNKAVHIGGLLMLIVINIYLINLRDEHREVDVRQNQYRR
jgi:hypothetical protein